MKCAVREFRDCRGWPLRFERRQALTEAFVLLPPAPWEVI